MINQQLDSAVPADDAAAVFLRHSSGVFVLRVHPTAGSYRRATLLASQVSQVVVVTAPAAAAAMSRATTMHRCLLPCDGGQTTSVKHTLTQATDCQSTNQSHSARRASIIASVQSIKSVTCLPITVAWPLCCAPLSRVGLPDLSDRRITPLVRTTTLWKAFSTIFATSYLGLISRLISSGIPTTLG